MQAFRLGTYLGVCIVSVWCVTNTPIGEWVLEKAQFVKIPPDTSSVETDAAFRAALVRKREFVADEERRAAQRISQESDRLIELRRKRLEEEANKRAGI